MAQPATPVEHRMVSDAISSRVVRMWGVYGRLREDMLALNVLALCHYALSGVPNAAYVDLTVTDQGGDTMTFAGIGVLREDYDAWTDDRSYERMPDGTSDLRYITWEPMGAPKIVNAEYVAMDVTYDAFNMAEGGLNEDEIHDLAMNLEDDSLAEWGRFFQRVDGKRSGRGRIWIEAALETFTRTFEGFIGEALDPFPDPNDTVAVAAWLARETAPTKED